MSYNYIHRVKSLIDNYLIDYDYSNDLYHLFRTATIKVQPQELIQRIIIILHKNCTYSIIQYAYKTKCPTRVSPLMHNQATFAGKSFFTVGACKWFLPSVEPHMIVQ